MRRKWRRVKLMTASTVVTATLLLLAVHTLVTPLDLLWYRVARNFRIAMAPFIG